MELILTYGSGRKNEVLNIEPGQTPREALRAQFGHEINFLTLGGHLPQNPDDPYVEEEFPPISGPYLTNEQVAALPEPIEEVKNVEPVGGSFEQPETTDAGSLNEQHDEPEIGTV